ncbi:MAG: 1-(5-phosphoribosyl)-5-[(5-phosphoribosylamino)methylideneamino]imidazole-4-carboxamide isomerase [Vicinamibacteria bacterium]
MEVFPAIDLRGGRCVRLVRGEKGSETRYAENAVAVASFWESQGASMLHVVDLDAAFGEPNQRELLKQILRSVSIPVQVGGGVRSHEDFLELRDAGARRIVFGTLAAERPAAVVERALASDAEAVVVGVDVKEGRVAVRGWAERAGDDPIELGRRLRRSGARSFVYTEVGRDGVMEGLDLEATERFARAVGGNVIASGGVGSLAHLEASRTLAASGVEGVIVGRALYERAFTLADARRVLEG